MDTRLQGKRILITGASGGLGSQIAQEMWRAGGHLMLVGRSEARLSELRARLVPTGRADQEIQVVAVDLREPGAVDSIVRSLRGSWSGVDILVNNAAMIGPIGRIWQSDWAEWQATLQVDLIAPIALCRACIPFMEERGGGKIINLSGGGATGPRPNFSAYGVAKAGLVRFSETLAHEVSDLNIQVNCIAPGMMNTDMLRAVVQAGPEQAGIAEYAQATAQAQRAEDALLRAASLCVYLATEASDAITGRLISAVWDNWEQLADHADELQGSDIYTLRRIVAADRGKDWD